MSRKCNEVANAIWEAVRAQAEIPPELTAHAADCPRCQPALQEARRILGLMDLYPIPPAPDCQEAVMAGILHPSRSIRWTWAYASAVLVAILILALAVPRSINTPNRRPTLSLTSATAVRPQPPMPPKLTTEAGTLSIEKPVAPPKHHHKARLTGRYLVSTKAHNQPRPAAIIAQKKPEPAVSDRQPVMEVVVTWLDRHADGSYGYSVTDPDTGVTTNCKSTTSDGEVTIDLESIPPGGTPNPGGGA